VTEKKTSLQRRGEQLPLDLPVYVANATWFLMFSAEIQNNLVARMTPNVFAVWVVMRAHADLSSGKVYLSTSDLQRLTGLSRKTVLKAVERLAEDQHIQIVSDGKQKRRFFVIDVLRFRVAGTDPQTALEELTSGRESGHLQVRYVPKTAARDRAEITQFLETGQHPVSTNVMRVEAGATVNVGHVERLEQHLHVHIDNPELQQRLERMMLLSKQRNDEEKT
jgi:biotin operon repressor